MEKNHLSMPHLKVDCSDQKTDFFFSWGQFSSSNSQSYA